MNQDQMQGKWHQLKGSAKQRWGRLTDDDWSTLDGTQEKLVGKLQERYGIQREEAERQFDEWMRAQKAA